MKPLGESGPREVGPYRVLAELGRGGMGRVLLGSGPDGRLVALKLVHDQFAEDDGFRARFRREVDASRAVSGAYTAAVVDADPDAPTPWLASVFVPGPTLHETIEANGALPEQPVLRLAAGLATALTHIHRADLVHRDLKPSNVLLTDDGPRVLDFGIVRAVKGDEAGELTRTGWLIGSPGFMSPEQAKGEPVTSASDVFSLGSVLVAASRGKGPFLAAATLQTLNNVVLTEPDLDGVPEGIRRIVRPCLAKEPADRPTTAELLASIGPIAPAAQPWPAGVRRLIADRQAEITALLDGAPDETTVVIRKREPTSTKVEPPRARPWLRVAAVVVAVALVGFLVWTLWPERTEQAAAPPPPPPQIAQIGEFRGSAPAWGVEFSQDGRVLATLHRDQTVQTWDVENRRQAGQLLGPFGQYGPRDVAFSQDGGTLTTARVDGRSSVVQQWDIASGHQKGESLVVAGASEYSDVLAPALSQDGGTVAVQSDDFEDYRLWLWDVAGRKEVGVLDTPRATTTGPGPRPVFGPDGRTLVDAGWDSEAKMAILTVWDAAGAQLGNPITLLKDELPRAQAFSPDGALLVTGSYTGDTAWVRLWDAASHNQVRQPLTIPGGRDLWQVALSPDGRTLATVDFGAETRSLRLWQVETGQQIGETIDGVNGVAFNPDGRTLATAGEDNVVRLWTFPSAG
ncbi:WD40 repeat domain-containing serine/threonine protein kinase [Amycolatopsis sp. YIM 10]|uniref:WD40 repeat domain-containing serine/threonine protein kinase n=1 Tax=Amycolatopsis sp. YIM 10 TaxID=2653857 RepID=UPI00128FE0A9|nr:serine/threonine-protein kinase [Amycolatopsis sp. YIM 10]QFU91228.1 Serine/threonine-protein kinase AfsK [Amycolatopsis sp. YIM 10]